MYEAKVKEEQREEEKKKKIEQKMAQIDEKNDKVPNLFNVYSLQRRSLSSSVSCLSLLLLSNQGKMPQKSFIFQKPIESFSLTVSDLVLC